MYEICLASLHIYHFPHPFFISEITTFFIISSNSSHVGIGVMGKVSPSREQFFFFRKDGGIM
jgi:hypothetical protein